MRTTFLRVLALLIATAGWGAVEAGETTEKSLYERLGGWENIERIVDTTIDLHMQNPEIGSFFAEVDKEVLASHVVAFFAAGTGGPSKYEGRDMTSAHAGMNMSDSDFDAAVADVVKALKKNGVGDAEVVEVKGILESLRPAVMGTAEQAVRR